MSTLLTRVFPQDIIISWLIYFHNSARSLWIYFQDSASTLMEAIIEIHHYVMYYHINIAYAVLWIVVAIVCFYTFDAYSKIYSKHRTLIKLILTPAILLIFITVHTTHPGITDSTPVSTIELYRMFSNCRGIDFANKGDEFNYITYLVTGIILLLLLILGSFITLFYQNLKKGGSEKECLDEAYNVITSWILYIMLYIFLILFAIYFIWLAAKTATHYFPPRVFECASQVPRRVLFENLIYPPDVKGIIEEAQSLRMIKPNEYFLQFPDYSSMTDEQKLELLNHTTDLVNHQYNTYGARCEMVTNSMFRGCKPFGRLVNQLLADQSPRFHMLWAMGQEHGSSRVLGKLCVHRADFLKAMNGNID